MCHFNALGEKCTACKFVLHIRTAKQLITVKLDAVIAIAVPVYLCNNLHAAQSKAILLMLIWSAYMLHQVYFLATAIVKYLISILNDLFLCDVSV